MAERVDVIFKWEPGGVYVLLERLRHVVTIEIPSIGETEYVSGLVFLCGKHCIHPVIHTNRVRLGGFKFELLGIFNQDHPPLQVDGLPGKIDNLTCTHHRGDSKNYELLEPWMWNRRLPRLVSPAATGLFPKQQALAI